QRAVRAGLLHRLLDRVPHGKAFVRRPALARRHAADDVRAVLLAARGVEGAFLARDALHHHARALVDQDAHALPPFANATALRAPSPMSSAIVSDSPDSASMRLPIST